jgi:zinc D-Ala-D-Ala carboxypeptidase
MIADFALSPHFSFYELTATSNAAMQELNRQEAMQYLPTLKALAAQLLEPIRAGRPLVVNSAFRAFALNKATAGSSSTSQHPVGQAADIHRPGMPVGDFFAEVLALVKERRLPFGQLIHERAQRDYGVAEWVHISLGRDFWKPERCGEVLAMTAGADGVPHYQLIEKLSFPEEAHG